MAKGKDPFDTFRAATLSTSSLSDAISTPREAASEPVKAETPSPTPKAEIRKKEKPALEQVSFFIDKDLKKAVGLLKYELDVQLKDLYEEAIRELLKKYKKL